MLLGYDALQRRRDTNFNRVREAGNGLSPTRVFVESNTLDIYEYWFALRAEIEWVAEMLSSFDGYAQLSSEDKATLFKNFWILFIILERSFDSYRVCGVDLDDRRMVSSQVVIRRSDFSQALFLQVFCHGIIADVLSCNFDISEVSEPPAPHRADMGPLCYPWFKHCARELLIPVKRLRPTEVELMFALGLMFWKISVDTRAHVSAECAQLADRMVDRIYAELEAYYAAEMPQASRVQRVAEMLVMISISEVSLA